ncbi:hypothetical protein QVD17_01351 [Tagetes erecta]|uniref:Uncharacterized protein n=1 Tax=Tagetes erecta TaxID=13708 RepID=A0AAD8P1E8_TARER|nr:hypothetical protein QVD17_01351 [Tagetes erecta]
MIKMKYPSMFLIEDEWMTIDKFMPPGTNTYRKLRASIQPRGSRDCVLIAFDPTVIMYPHFSSLSQNLFSRPFPFSGRLNPIFR